MESFLRIFCLTTIKAQIMSLLLMWRPVLSCSDRFLFACWCIIVWTLQRRQVVLEGWLTTVKLETVRLSSTPLMEPLIWSWWLPETSKQRRSCCMTTAIGVKPQSLLTLGSNTETLTTSVCISDKLVLYAVKDALDEQSSTCFFYEVKKKSFCFKWRLKLQLMKSVFLRQLFLSCFYIFLIKL